VGKKDFHRSFQGKILLRLFHPSKNITVTMVIPYGMNTGLRYYGQFRQIGAE